MKITVNDIEIDTKYHGAMISKFRGQTAKEKTKYHVEVIISSSKELNSYEREKLEDFISQVLNED